MNAGEKILDWLRHEQLRVDDEWSVELPNGFAWWAAKNKQTITIVGEKEGPDGGMGYFVRVETEVFKEVVLEGSRKEALDLLMSTASMSAIVHREDGGRLNLCTVVRIHEGVREWMAPLISIAAMVQILDARRFGDAFADLGWSPAVSPHPESGLRIEPDELVEGVEGLLASTGKVPSRWEEDELAYTLERFMQQPPCLLANGGGLSLTAEFPYGDFSSLLRVHANQEHPGLGSGLLLTQHFPDKVRKEGEGTFEALDLNHAMYAGAPIDSPLGCGYGFGFGSFCYREGCVCFTSFLPNAAYRSGLLPNAYFASLSRAHFAALRYTGETWI